MIRLLVKFGGVGLIFLAPLIHAFVKFRTVNEVEAQEASEVASYGIIGGMIIAVGIFFAIAFIYAQIKSQITNNPFGMVSIIFFGGIFTFVSVGVRIILSYTLNQAQANFEAFQGTMQMYIDNSTLFIGYQVAGIIMVVTSKFIN